MCTGYWVELLGSLSTAQFISSAKGKPALLHGSLNVWWVLMAFAIILYNVVSPTIIGFPVYSSVSVFVSYVCSPCCNIAIVIDENSLCRQRTIFGGVFSERFLLLKWCLKLGENLLHLTRELALQAYLILPGLTTAYLKNKRFELPWRKQKFKYK